MANKDVNILINKIKSTIKELKELGVYTSSFESKLDSIIKEHEEGLNNTMEVAVNKGTKSAINFIDRTDNNFVNKLNELLEALTGEETTKVKDQILKRNSLLDDIKNLLEELKDNGIDITKEESIYEKIKRNAKDLVITLKDDPKKTIFIGVWFAEKQDARKLLPNEGIIDKAEELKTILENALKQTKEMNDTEKRIYNLNTKISDYYTKLEELTTDAVTLNNKEKKKRIKAIKDLLKRMSAFLAASSVTVGLLGGAGVASYGLTTSKKYKTAKITYSSLTDETKKEELYLATEDKTIVLDINPYYHNKEGYKRNVVSFDVTSLEEKPLKEYLNLDFNILGIDGENIEEEPIKKLNAEEIYSETYQLVEKYIIDKDDNYLDTDILLFCATIGMLEAFAIIILLIIKSMINDIVLVGNDDFIFYEIIKKLIRSIENLKKSNKTYKEAKEEIEDIKMQILELFIHHKHEMDELISLMPTMEKNPKFEACITDLNKKINRIKKVNDNLIKGVIR